MTGRFGVFTFDDRTVILRRSDRPVALEPQPMSRSADDRLESLDEDVAA